MEDRSKFIDLIKREKGIVRITLLGDGAVGKTTIVSQFLSKFGKIENQLPKEERTPFMNIISWKQGDFTIQCFDLAGQRIEKAHPIDLLNKQVLTGLDVIFFVFTLDRFSSFENLETWYSLVEKQLNGEMEKIKLVLIGNKDDLDHSVDKELIEKSLENGMFSEYINISAISENGILPISEIIDKIGKINHKME